MTFLVVCNALDVNPLKCVLIIKQECKIRTKIIAINNNEPLFYPHSVEVNKCSVSFNDINNPYSKVCVPDVIKDINVFNLMSRTNEARHIDWHET